MSDCVFKHLSKLNAIAHAKPKIRKQILEKANLALIKSIVECIENVLKGNITLNKQCKEKLTKYKSILRKIFNAEKKLATKKKIIVQNGGAFLPALLAPVITVLADRYLRG